MRFERIKATDELVELDWTTRAKNGTEESTSMRAKENPGPGLLNALTAFKDFVVGILDLPEVYESGLKVTTLHISAQEKGARGLVLTCRKDLDSHPTPFHFNTPLVREALDVENEGKGGFFPADLADLISKAERQAEAFVMAQRQQGDLFATPAQQDEARADADGNAAALALETGAKKTRARGLRKNKVPPSPESAYAEPEPEDDQPPAHKSRRPRRILHPVNDGGSE